jgi:hypothetical protein
MTGARGVCAARSAGPITIRPAAARASVGRDIRKIVSIK